MKRFSCSKALLYLYPFTEAIHYNSSLQSELFMLEAWGIAASFGWNEQLIPR